QEIVAERTPLGRILIEHDVLRSIHPTAFLRVLPGRAVRKWFGPEEPRLTYGRLAYIHCGGRPAGGVLEIVAAGGRGASFLPAPIAGLPGGTYNPLNRTWQGIGAGAVRPGRDALKIEPFLGAPRALITWFGADRMSSIAVRWLPTKPRSRRLAGRAGVPLAG